MNSLSPVSARSPSHITGFFAARRKDDPMQSGSVGCGICLNKMALTTVELIDISKEDKIVNDHKIVINGLTSDAPVSRYVAERMAKMPVSIKTDLEMPQGAGFGASGAGALSCALALNMLFDLGNTMDQTASNAHCADVMNRTGLGDVIAQNTGGLVVRIASGAPGIGHVDRIPVPPLAVSYVVRGPISTRDVLSDEKTMRIINELGEAALKELLKRPTLEEFMRLSRRFTIESGLASSWALDAIEAVWSAGGMASMIMLGDAVFAIGKCNTLKEFGEIHTTKISLQGACLL